MRKRTSGKSVLALLLCVCVAAMIFVGCGVQTKSETEPQTTAAAAGGEEATTEAAAKVEPGKLTLLFTSSLEKIANIVRDELTAAGYEVSMSAQTDNSSYKEQKKAGNYDICIDNWSSPTGIPDFLIRPIVYTGGSQNLNGYTDPDIDALIDKAAAMSPDEYWPVYDEISKKAMDDLAWVTPLYAEYKARACTDVFDGDTLMMMSTYSNFTYKDKSLNDTRTLKIGTTNFTFTNFDTMRTDDASIGSFAMNLYIRLLDQNDDYTYTTDDTLSHSYAISEDNQEYYFLLRDDCFFTRVNADTTLNPTAVMVSGEDVLYSFERIMNKDSMPTNAAYSNFANVEKVEMVSDIEELKNVKTAGGKTILEALNADVKSECKELVTDKTAVDNKAGKYQVIRLKTSIPFPQILAYLCNHTAGIVDSEWVESINGQVDIANYDAAKDVLYADSTGCQEGAGFNNTLSCSGRYVLRSFNDYGAVLEKNPGLHKDENPEGSALIKNIEVVFASDADSALSALRSGDIDINWSIATTKFDTVREDSSLDLRKFLGQRYWFLSYNINSPACADAAQRAAIANSINLDHVQAGMGEVIVQHDMFMVLKFD